MCRCHLCVCIHNSTMIESLFSSAWMHALEAGNPLREGSAGSVLYGSCAFEACSVAAAKVAPCLCTLLHFV